MERMIGLYKGGLIPSFKELLARDLFLKAVSEEGLQTTKEGDPEAYAAFQEGLRGTMETCWEAAEEFERFVKQKNNSEEEKRQLRIKKATEDYERIRGFLGIYNRVNYGILLEKVKTGRGWDQRFYLDEEQKKLALEVLSGIEDIWEEVSY